MKTPLNIISDFFDILNITELTSIITGGIYKIDKPKDSELQDIVINNLFMTGKENEVQNGDFNINIYAKNIQGVTDTNTLQIISDKVLEILENYNQKVTSLNFEVIDFNILKDMQQNSMSYLNIKLKIHKL